LDKSILLSYRKNKKELVAIDMALEKLEDQLDELPVVCGRITKSGKEFPYIEEHVVVQMIDPREADIIKKRMYEKTVRKTVLLKEIKEVEDFIDSMPDGIDKEIFEMLYLDGMTQREIGECIGLERSAISKRVDRYLELSHDSHF